jgi:HAD superfamily hydrolase (TIGR01549 family)
MPPGKVQGLVFDLDNTILQSRLGAEQGLQVASSIITAQLDKVGFNFNRSSILSKLRRIERDRRAPESGLVPRALYDRDNWWKVLLKQLHASSFQGPWIHKTTMRYWSAYQENSPPFPDAESTLRILKRSGYRLAMVSDSDGTLGMKMRRIRGLTFRDLFETVVVAGEDTPKLKPSRGPFFLVAKKLKLSPSVCAYIGDNPETDIEGAKATAMTTILVKRKIYAVRTEREDPPPKPTFEVKALKEIPAILKN